MGAPLAYVLSERTMCWRTQTPGSVTAVASTVTAWCYSASRQSIVWGQGGEAADSCDVYKSAPDDDLDDPIPGATLITYPMIPDDDVTAVKTFHEIVATFTVIEVASSAPNFDFKFGFDGGGTTSVSSRALPNNPATPTREAPAYYQARVMVPRGYSQGQSLVVQVTEPGADMGQWRLHAIEPVWEPASVGATNR